VDDNQPWQSFNFPFVAEKFPVDILVDENAYVWMTLNPQQGGGIAVFDRASSRSAYLNDQSGTGGLPSKSVYSMAFDRDAYVWVGTDEGVAYFFDSGEIFSSSADAIKPIFDNRFLLKSETITAIEVDGGNRKWMGTKNGVWLFNPTGESLVYNFTTSNSPLISNVINDIEINDETGEVFFATDKGIVSYRGDATEGSSAFTGIKIFPNPVTHAFNGTVGITGLASDAIVKITDVSGKLIWQTQANGGTATWSLLDNNGRRTSTGIYLVFAATPDGSENIVGKIAIIE
jgi:ligand-binding sensor domain-containing protein